MQKATNSIFAISLAPSKGIPTQVANVGEIEGSGLEANLYARVLRMSDVSLDLNFIWNHSTNKVTDLGTAPPVYLGANALAVGQPRGAFYANPIVGVIYDSSGKYFKPKIDTSTRVYYGNPVAPNNGSFSITLKLFNQFTLYGLADFQLGGTIHNESKQFATQFRNIGEYNRLQGLLGLTVSDTNIKSLTIGSAEYKAASEKFALMDPNEPGAPVYFESSDFLRIRELSLRWDATSLVSDYLTDVFKNISLTVAARNVALFSKYSFPDPEVNSVGASRTISRGRDFLTLQNPRVIYGTITLGF
jgi:hypothetical protein